MFLDTAGEREPATTGLRSGLGPKGARSGQDLAHFGGVQGFHQMPKQAQISPESAHVEHFEAGKAATRPTQGQWRPQEGPSGGCHPRSGMKLEDSQAEVGKSEFLGTFEPSFTHTLQAPPYPSLTHTHTRSTKVTTIAADNPTGGGC